LEKLVDLQERVMRINAERAFNSAIQAFQFECPSIKHDGHAAFGNTKYSYATLAQVANTIRPYLDKHGLSYGFTSESVSDGIKVTCTVKHVEGHSGSADFVVAIDNNAKGMNIAQRAASALSYARRYALLMALGITTADTDDDGAGAGEPPLSKPNPGKKAVTKQDLQDLFRAYRDFRGFNSEDSDEQKLEVGRLCETKVGVNKDKWTDPSLWQPDQLQVMWSILEGVEAL